MPCRRAGHTNLRTFALVPSRLNSAAFIAGARKPAPLGERERQQLMQLGADLELAAYKKEEGRTRQLRAWP